MSSMLKLELENGEEINLTLNFAALYKLRAEKKDVYEKYNKVVITGGEEIFDTVDILYTAYLCANIKDISACMEYEEFIEKLPYAPRKIAEKVRELMSPKKKKVSEQHS